MGLVFGYLAKPGFGAVGPSDFDGFDRLAVAKTVMRHRLHLAQIPASRVDGLGMDPHVCFQNDRCAACRRTLSGQRRDPQIPARTVDGGAEQAQWLRRAFTMRDEKVEHTVPVHIRDGRACAETIGLQRRRQGDRFQHPAVAHPEHPVRLADIVEEDFVETVIVEIGADHGSDEGRLPERLRRVIQEAVPRGHIGPVIAVPVADDDPETAVIQDVGKSSSPAVLARVIDAVFHSPVDETTIEILVEETRTLFIGGEHIVP